jgi:hypothetical protein
VKDAYVRSWEGYQEHVGWAKDYDSPKVIGGEERDEVQEWLESQKGHNAEASCDTCISWWASVAKHQFDDELPADALIRAVDTCTTWDLLLEQAAKNNVDVQSLLSDAKEHTIAMTCSFYESEDSYFNTVEPPKQPVKDEPSSKAMEDFKAANPHLFEVKQESAPLVVLGSEDKAREMTEKLEDNVDALAKRIEANIQSITQNATDKDYSDIEVID